MIPSSFTYKKANSVDEALQLMGQHGDDAKILAGGHSLVPTLKLRLNEVGYLIDISKIDSLKGIKEDSGYIVIGAGVTHGEIADSDLIKEKLPIFAEGADLIGDVQVRNFGTIGGSIAHADPAADWPGILLASDAEIAVQGASGTRKIAASDFFFGLYMTNLEEGEIVTAIHVPIPPEGTKGKYVKFMQPASRFAVVGCAAIITRTNGYCENVRVAFNGVSAKPYRDGGVEAVLEGAEYSDANVAEAASKAAESESILSDHFASEEYRKHIAKVYTKRALQALA